MASSNDIRAIFLDYFARNGHAVVESSPLVPRNDPTLLFTNSGMVQFKNVFTGQEKRPYTRATTAQKCVRAGGKHNDLDNVGYTARHHTFFEMLGNFSFGDYFKDQAIFHAWTLVTKDFGLPADRLTVTVFSEDDEAAALWRKIAGLPEERIVRIPTSDNFWRMGDTGPCGPCSEIFFDHGPGVAGGPPGSAEADGDRFVEIWNLVFMQYEEGPPGTRVPLPRPSIDTGMGLERTAAILQGKQDNYDTDTLRALILASAEATGQDPDGPHKVSHRVIADHLRSTAFLIADGVLPTNEGRGYVLRRIMRRAMRHAHMMGAREPVMWRLVPALVRQMGAAYAELVRAEGLIEDTLKLEETRFKAMLDRGLGLLAEEAEKLGANGTLPGEVAFRLYDTFGFPLDLDPGRAARAGARSGRGRVRGGHGRAEASRPCRLGRLGRGGDRPGMVRGARERRRQRVPWLFHRKGGSGDRCSGGRRASGGARRGGRGRGGGAEPDAVLRRKRRPGGRYRRDQRARAAHCGARHAEEAGRAVRPPRPGAGGRGGGRHMVVAEVDHARRTAIRAHHSATHLLHEALRRRLGSHVQQKGSMNGPDRLRFDISQPTPIGREDLAWVEDQVNAACARTRR